MHEPTPYLPPTASRGRPAVITWYRVYAITMPLLYVNGLVVWQFALAKNTSSQDVLLGAIAIAVLVSAFFAVAALVPYRPWGWTMGLAAIAIGLMTLLAPASVALLLHWMRPETKAAFCRL